MKEKPKSETDLVDLLCSHAFYGLPPSGPHVPDMYEVRYKCSRCGWKWNDVHVGLSPVEDTQDCRMGCSEGYHRPLSFLALYRRIESLITGKEPIGFGRLVDAKKIQ